MVQDPAKARLHEEAARLNRKVAAGSQEVENLKRQAKAQAKRVAKLQKDLKELQESKVTSRMLQPLRSARKQGNSR